MSTVNRVSGSKSSRRSIKSRNSLLCVVVGGMICASDFMPLTYLRDEREMLEFGKSILPPLKNSPFFSLDISSASALPPNLAARKQAHWQRGETEATYRPFSTILAGIRPMTTSIMAKCSRLSCVWNNASPVKNSTRIHPIENMSHGYDHDMPVESQSALPRLVLNHHLVLVKAMTAMRARTEDDFWGTVMPRGNDRRVILVLERRATKVDQADIGITEDRP